ncbi:hypothetical protein EV421DRAFT_1812262 [Armillaria borealis]|uniref:Uncharacterized protein n=1 Tax=Armillaria borealis TaxID=47425 RepID=A0AA39JFA3_9AGAR|nr:hypothetical protein EV421DRAFT_1812262 [Armillaria borealis]
MLMASLSQTKTREERKIVTFDTPAPASPPPRGIKRSIEEVDACLDEDDVERRGHPVWSAVSDRLSSAITCDVNAFAPTALWASPWGSHSVYDESTENTMATDVLVEAMGGFAVASSQTATSGLYMEITRVISRLIDGSITRNDLIEGLQRLASQLRHCG